MYRLGEAKHNHRKRRVAIVLTLLVVGALLFFGWKSLKANTHISAPPAALKTTVSYATAKVVTFTEPLFSIDLPDDWKPITRGSDIPVPIYSWQGTSKDNNKRWVSVYIDQSVASLATNRALYVEANNGTSINVLSDTSDNCTNFTGAASQNTHTTPAKWQGIDFICDSGNYERDVVGVVSPDGLNNLNLTGTSGSHRFFITYTDNSISPDYDIFTAALRSFKVK